jgi:tetratricopeptide (TPR) repeat protein
VQLPNRYFNVQLVERTMLTCVFALLLWQPNTDAIRRLFEENLAQRQNAQAARDLGLFLKQQGDATGARRALALALGMEEKESGAASEATLADAAELASVSEPDQAARLWRRAAESRNPALASEALAALAESRIEAGDGAGAAALLRKAVAKAEEASGKESAQVAVRLNGLAQTVAAKEGVPLLERALAIERRQLGEGHPETASTMANLAGLYVNTGRADEALRLAAAAIAILDKTLGPAHPRTAAACTVAAFAARDKGDRAQAEKLFRRALEIDERAYGPQHAETLRDARNLAEFLRSVRPQ